VRTAVSALHAAAAALLLSAGCRAGGTAVEADGCRRCHGRVSGIDPAHARLSCAACHLGNPEGADSAAAHAGLEPVPGNLDRAHLGCGKAGCHLGELARVRASPMATGRGMVAVNRWAFGERPTPDGTDTVRELGDSAADTHFRQLCASCHLGRRKDRPGPTGELSRGGGCAACHLRESGPRDYAPAKAGAFLHPRLARTPEDASCFGCHSRSARISIAYEGWWDAGVDDEEAPHRAPGTWRRLDDGRWVARAAPDVHRVRGMGCADCHTSGEVMGDGRAHLHEEQATRVRCSTCHRVAPARTVEVASLGAAAAATVRARFGGAPPERLLAEDRSGEPLTHAWPRPDGSVELRGKLDGRPRLARPPAAACAEIAGHARLSCQACHSAWTTSCITCHTRFDPAQRRRDGPTGELRAGAWLEQEGTPRIGPPALALFARDGEERIEPAAPGMILDITGPPPGGSPPPLAGGSPRFLRAFALAAPHTTARAGRSCDSCHRDPSALGYGRGELRLRRRGKEWRWRFEPAHVLDARDGLPQDAWIAFLRPGGGGATRTELRPLDRGSQLRALAVGACLGCHDPLAPGGRMLYLRFRDSLSQATPHCRVPFTPSVQSGEDP